MNDRTRLTTPILAAALLLAAAAPRAGAQEVSPRWSFFGRGLLAVTVADEGGAPLAPDWTLVNHADTAVNMRVDQLLFGRTVGAFAVGARLTDRDSPLGDVYLFQAAAHLEGRNWTATFGRSRRPTRTVEFPTLRDEDLLTFTAPLNPYSLGGLEEDALFGDFLAVTWRRDMRWHVTGSIESPRNTLAGGDPADPGDFAPRGGGLRLHFEELPAYARLNRWKHAGVSVRAFEAGDRLGVGSYAPDLVWQGTAALALNLRADPIHLWDLRVVGLVQDGREVVRPGGVTDDWQASYWSVAAGLRYLHAPYQLDRLQLGLSAGYRRYAEGDVWEARVIPSAVYRLGVNVDLAAQYKYSRRQADLAAAGMPETGHVFEVAFVYGFDVRVNDSFVLPRHILNVEHEYVPAN